MLQGLDQKNSVLWEMFLQYPTALLSKKKSSYERLISSYLFDKRVINLHYCKTRAEVFITALDCYILMIVICL